VRHTVPPSAEIQAEIDKLLGSGLVDDPQKMLSELARLGARLIIQRAVEEEFDSWLGRARYERRPERQRGLRNGFRPRRLQTGEGELRIEVPQLGGGDAVRVEAVPLPVRGGSRRGYGGRLNLARSLRSAESASYVRVLWRPEDHAASPRRPKCTIASARCERWRDRRLTTSGFRGGSGRQPAFPNRRNCGPRRQRCSARSVARVCGGCRNPLRKR
jgi:hypothetical protein